MVNIIRESYRDYFELDYSLQAVETITDRHQTMTYALIYMGFFLVVLLNIFISNYMSSFWTIILTFPFFQIGLYIGKMPALIYMALLIFSYTAVVLLKRSGHYSLSKNKKKDKPFIRRKQIVTYKGHGKTMVQILGGACVLALCFSVITYPLMNADSFTFHSKSKLKIVADSYVRTFVQNGLLGFFNRYQAAGGISGGKLGGVSSIQADYQPDLEVTFAPVNADMVYLKAFTGAGYTSNQWMPADFSEEELVEAIGIENYEAYSDYTAHLEANRIALFQEDNSSNVVSGKMRIKNVGAKEDYLYLPYYTRQNSPAAYRTDHSLISGSSSRDTSYTVEYFPYSEEMWERMDTEANSSMSGDTVDETVKTFLQYYGQYNEQYYQEIPEDLQPVLTETMKEIPEGKTVAEQIQNISNYFVSNFHYSISPGATPLDQDFVTYFLQTQKVGYCSHFASAGTMLCRAYGIPARYVEGYAIQVSDLANATADSEEDISNWLTGKGVGENTGVVTVSVPDANAHAWTEIYLENFGWIPVDFTPPSTEVDAQEEYSSFLALFTGLFLSDNVGADSKSEADGDSNQNVVSEFVERNTTGTIGVAVIVVLLCTMPLWYKGIGCGYAYVIWKKNYKQGRYDQALPYFYHRLRREADRFDQKGKTNFFEQVKLPEAFFSRLAMVTKEESDAKKACSILEKCLYGKHQIAREEADFFLLYVEKTCKMMKNKAYITREK